MTKTIFSKMMYVGRATVFAVGVAVMLALTVGLASAALAANGGNFILGQSNAATAITKLAGRLGVDGPMLRIDNNNAGANATALDLQVESGKAPMTVDSDAKVENLNADNLDGQDSSAFLGADQKAADSKLLDGQDSTAFLASNGKAADADKLDGRELSSGRVTLNLPPSGGGTAVSLLQAGALSVSASCVRNSSGAFAIVVVRTTEPGSAVSAHSVELGGVESTVLNPGFSTDIASTGPPATAPAVDHATYSAVAPNGDTLQGEVFASANVQGSTCVFSASGIE